MCKVLVNRVNTPVKKLKESESSVCFPPFYHGIFQMGGGASGMNSSMVPMSRPGVEGTGVSGGYSGANNMANNGLNPNQNQVKCMINASSPGYIIILV